MATRHATSGHDADPNCDTDSAPVRRVRVLLPLPLAEAYDYRLPDGLDAAPGDCVLVPLGSRRMSGYIVGYENFLGHTPHHKQALYSDDQGCR